MGLGKRALVAHLLGRNTHDIDFALSAVVHRHITPFSGIVAVGEQLAGEVFERIPTLLENTGFSVLACYDISWCQRRRRAHCYSLFAR